MVREVVFLEHHHDTGTKRTQKSDLSSRSTANMSLIQHAAHSFSAMKTEKLGGSEAENTIAAAALAPSWYRSRVIDFPLMHNVPFSATALSICSLEKIVLGRQV
jgi:hypothetical protein